MLEDDFVIGDMIAVNRLVSPVVPVDINDDVSEFDDSAIANAAKPTRLKTMAIIAVPTLSTL